MATKVVCRFLVALAVALPATGQIDDTEPPRLTGLSFGPNPIDVTAGARTLTIEMRVTDNLSGASSVFGSVTSPLNRQQISFFATLFSGTFQNGVWRGTVEIPRYSDAGDWTMEVGLWDAVTNRVSLNAAALRALRFPADLKVLSVPDVQAPRVTGIRITPASVNVSSAPQTVTVDLTLTDDVSGVRLGQPRFGETVLTVLGPAPGFQVHGAFSTQFTLVSGTVLNGTWRTTITIPRYSQPGTWGINVFLVDNANNRASYPTSTLPPPSSFEVTSFPADTSAPRLTELSFTPRAIDTSTEGQFVRVQIRTTDDRSGVSFAHPFRSGSFFMSPSGAQFRFFETRTLSAGTPTAGTWEGLAFFPRFSEAGTWSMNGLALQDVTVNRLFLPTAELNRLGFPTDLVVIREFGGEDGRVGPGGGRIPDGSFGDRASVIFPPGALRSETIVKIDVLRTPPAIPTPAGYSAGTFFMNITLDPVPVMPFPPPGISVVLPIANFIAPGTAIQLFRLDPVTGVLVPAVKVGGGNVTGTVRDDGLSASFSGVSRLSTVVGFIATSVPGDVNGDGQVNCTDVAIVKAAFGKRSGQTGFDFRADVTRDGVVNVLDLSIVSQRLSPGTTCP
jgi:hypothetical protein